MQITKLLDQFKSFYEAALNFSCGAKLNKSIRKNIIEIIFLYIVIPRKINFLQMGRYGERSEQCYRQTFEREVDWMEFNIWLSAYAFKDASRRVAIAIAPSYISKSGNSTPHVGTFWSGCAGAARHGLEILGISVIDVDLHSCMMLRAVQTALEKGKEKNDMTLYQWYAKVLDDYRKQLQRVSDVLVADAAFSKSTFINLIRPMGFHLVSRLRHDAALYYLWEGGPTGKPGRPKIKGGKIDFKNLDKSRMEKLDIEPEDGEAYALKAYCKSLKRVVSLVIHLTPKGGHVLYFSTDENMSGRDVIEFYRTMFQIGFAFRDAKQFTGLTDSQARSVNKLDFSYNASFAALNVAKLVRMVAAPELSAGMLKQRMTDAHYLQRIICVFEKQPNITLNSDVIKELFRIADIAA